MASDDKPLAPDQQAIYDRVGDAIARGRDARNAQHEQTLARVERARAAVDRSRRPRSDENTLIEITEFAAYENRFGRRLRRSFGAVETALSRPMVTRPGSPEEEAKPEFRAEKKRLAGAWTPEIYLDNRKSQALVLAVSAVVVEHEAHGADNRDIETGIAVLDGVRRFAHSSFNHRHPAIDHEHRWRLVIETNRSMHPTREYPLVVAHVMDLHRQAGVVLAKESGELGRYWYKSLVRAGSDFSFASRQGVALDVDNILAREREKRTRPGEVLVDVVDGSVLRASDSQRAKAPHAQRANAQSDDMDMGQNGTSPAWVLRFATRYIAKVESGVRGANGRIQLFRAARHLASIVDDPRYPLTMADAWTLLAAFNERCVPPESDKQKLRDHFDRAFRGLKQPTKIGSRRR